MEQHEHEPVFDLVGIDPDSVDNRCCGVWVDPETGDPYFRGKIVTDPRILARFERDAPASADEGVFRLPARMRPIIAEAVTGTYEPGRIGHGDIDLDDLLKTARTSLIHLETRDTYDPDHPAYVDWKAGGDGLYDRSGWLGVVSSIAERGVRMRRSRVISSPPTDTTRWMHMHTDANVEAGEDVRWLVRDTAPDLLVPVADFWLIDHRLIVFSTTTGDGTFLRDHYSNDPDVIARSLLAFERIWERATPHIDFKIA
ncbi:DUF6879 family protein [Actinocorallia longicatena]|uniref:DUF6879 domain-containing protein n=1 Tax=Actinocorallia longicatena TaxID=111803 RepID=A0ABP6QFS4_9ACTN